MKVLPEFLVAIVLMGCFLGAAQAQARTKADIACQPSGEKLTYDCTVKLADSRTGDALSGISLGVGADMPSMPGAHSIRPAKATELAEHGTYRARVTLEMHGDWALQLNLSGPRRDRIVKVLRFEDDRVVEIKPPRPGSRHRH
jgi:hypothetical protein